MIVDVARSPQTKVLRVESGLNYSKLRNSHSNVSIIIIQFIREYRSHCIKQYHININTHENEWNITIYIVNTEEKEIIKCYTTVPASVTPLVERLLIPQKVVRLSTVYCSTYYYRT